MTTFNLLTRTVLLCTTLTSAQLYAAASVLIWPIDPIISDSDKATALWLENKDSQPIYMQIRVLGWQQVNTQDDYTSQSRIIASPPVATIQPGKRQLIRLVKNTQVPAGQEQAYRILIDEIPRQDPNDKNPASAAQLGLKFQMRYSVPLFVYGSGVLIKSDTLPAANTMPTKLSYSLATENGKQWLNINNQSAVHARISQVTLQGKEINKGLLGYILAGSKMSFPISSTARTGELAAIINNEIKPIVIPHR
ncbi:fimbrial biogenesis chaperone [Yersinia pekkanenii]|uniref:Chaperone protein n=1 Tax=Yersinia pekkanenii TaxID=1288385 RepID=A0A0T9QFQ5_9GAMM|nr:molecular chaperone [Yersinia pekkanenii]CNI09567.1 putative chaperone protein [Yersinia pekkanenii]CRY68003.1 putative chaperone protein [Yersinia pekkanenii]